jgi:hypothetical protein
MTGPSFKFDRDGPISKTPICCLQNGLTKNCKHYTRATQNLDQNGALSSERSPAGNLYESYRTENKIKNKFYGNIRIFLRFVVNYFNNTKEDTMWIHKINPSILNDIYKGTEGNHTISPRILRLRKLNGNRHPVNGLQRRQDQTPFEDLNLIGKIQKFLSQSHPTL